MGGRERGEGVRVNPALMLLMRKEATVSGALEYVGSPAQDSTSTSTYTFAGVNIGAESTNRVVVVTVHPNCSASRTVIGVTIGGVAATLDAASAADWRPSAVARAAVPTGTTADIVVTLSGAANRCGINVFAAPFPLALVAADAITAFNPSVSVATAAGGWLVAGSGKPDNYNMVWTGATEVYETPMGTGPRLGAAYALTTGSTVTVTQTSSGASGLAVATYRAA